MSRRHKRRSKLFDVHAARFVSEATEFHDKLSGYLLALRPQDEQYKAILALSQEVYRSVAVVSGATPPWAATPRSDASWSSNKSKGEEGQ